MKEKHVIGSMDCFWDVLGRSRLLTADELRQVAQRWHQETGDPADLAGFTRWLTVNRYATDFQVAMLLHGHAAHLHLGPYKLLERIGRGSMATVYKAVHRLGSLAALKVLPPSRARDPQVRALFQRETRLARALDHPNVVRTLEAGEDGGLHYLAMEYLEGETLQATLNRRGRLGIAEGVDLVRQALRGLQYLHDRGLIHRNLEPANLMQVRATTGLTVKILDTSLSRLASEECAVEEPNPCHLTWDGLVVGTPGYLAPEQARDAHAADIRSDIYSLGCILYHALAGQPPYADDSPLRQVIRHATETPRPLREFNPEVPEALQRIIDWMIAKDPVQRYQTPERAAAALEIVLAADSSPASPAPARSEEANPLPLTTQDAGIDLSFGYTAPLVFAAPTDSETSVARQELQDPKEQRCSAQFRKEVLGRRDCLFLVLGAGGLLVSQTLGWLVGRAARAKKSGKNRP